MSIVSDKNDSKFFLSSSIHNDLVSTLNIKHVRKSGDKKEFNAFIIAFFSLKL